ncbi:uncharacterized protein TNCV_2117531 [Trichonephila clavipes]|nr:uncharacterized protein TNCV_2117531 [Trichonephila clavipes]
MPRGVATAVSMIRGPNICNYSTTNKIVRVHYFVRGGFVRHRSRASSKHLSPHLPVDGARILGDQKGVALQVQDARVGVGSTKKPTPLDVDVRRSDVTVILFFGFRELNDEINVQQTLKDAKEEVNDQEVRNVRSKSHTP